MNQVFNQTYSDYYDLLYKNKNYQTEVEYILKVLSKHGVQKLDNLLELGCGTGGHAIHFLPNLTKWVGVDMSSSMLKKCTQNTLKYSNKCQIIEKDILELKLQEKFNCVLSLFHVASYQVSESALNKYFEVASAHTATNGYFIFDFWHGPGVLSDRPQNKLIQASNDMVNLTRETTPTLNCLNNTVNVKFDITIDYKNESRIEKFTENHLMRYLFYSEIQNIIQKFNFKILAAYKWGQFEPLDDKSWYGLIVLQKE